MTERPGTSNPRGLGIHWRGHALLFEGRGGPAYDAPAGLRLLLIFLVLEGVIGPRFALFGLLQLPPPPFALRVPILLGLALLSVGRVGRVRLSQIGFRPWREWSGTEKSYFLQVLVVANVVFSIVFADRLRSILAESSAPGRVWTAIPVYFLWGFYQEVVYRGILQTELVRRWGSVRGILVGNSLYTFGPLHFYHFTDTPSPLAMFACIFGIGLYFAALFRRSGNLWLAASFHGLGNAYILGTLGPL